MSSFNYYDKTVAVVGGSSMFINGSYITEVASEEEARDIARCLHESELLTKEVGITKRELTESEIIVALKENESFRVTEQTVALFKEAVELKTFVPSNALLELRESRTNTIGGKVDYVLSDGSVVWIDAETNRQLNTNIDIRESGDLISFMCTNATNFIRVVEELLEDQ